MAHQLSGDDEHSVWFDAPLAVYWTAELLYVYCLFVLCYWFMKMRYFKRYAPGM